jgi:hypothetical protein
MRDFYFYMISLYQVDFKSTPRIISAKAGSFIFYSTA